MGENKNTKEPKVEMEEAIERLSKRKIFSCVNSQNTII